MPEETPTRADLIQEFEEDEDDCFDSGRWNNITDFALSILAVARKPGGDSASLSKQESGANGVANPGVGSKRHRSKGFLGEIHRPELGGGTLGSWAAMGPTPPVWLGEAAGHPHS
jgi:hypothetical protein